MDADDEKNTRIFFRKAALQTAATLQKNLSINEVGYLRVVGYTHADARACYLYGVLDEVLKVGTTIIRWEEFLSGADKKQDEETSEDLHLKRIVTESVIDEQYLWVRKLTEILADLILFSTTNDQEYYRLYLVCRRLDTYLGLQKDFEDFFACRNLNIGSSIDDFCERIERFAKKVDITGNWFEIMSNGV
jgi:hypothetical protein